MLRNEYYCGIDVYNKRSRSKVRGRYVKDRSEWIQRTHDLPLIDPGLVPTAEWRPHGEWSPRLRVRRQDAAAYAAVAHLPTAGSSAGAR